METLITLYDQHFKNIKIDKQLVKELVKYRLKWSQKSDDYINFLSSNLTGVYPVRYSSIDEDNLYRLFKVDQKSLKRDSDRLRDIEPSRMVSSNVTYLSLVYLMYKFTQINNPKLTHEAIKELHFIFTIKALGSMFYRFFSYNLEQTTAKAAYERLSNRFIIKKEGSWQKVIDYRSNDVLPKGVYYDRLTKLTTLEATKIVAGIHGGYKSMLIYIFKVIKEVKDERETIASTTIIEKLEDGDAIRDDIDSPSLNINYIHSILPYQNDLINNDLVHLIVVISKNISDESLIEVLRYVSQHSNKYIDTTEFIIKQSMNYLRNKGIYKPTDDIVKSLTILKGYWGSGDTENKKIKEELKVASYKATGRKTSWLLSSLTISTIIYIYLRTIVKK